jgi:hypothetical protein
MYVVLLNIRLSIAEVYQIYSFHEIMEVQLYQAVSPNGIKEDNH